MPDLEANQWLFLSSLIYHIYSEEDADRMRARFLQDLRLLIRYDSADFFMSGRLKTQIRNIREGRIRGDIPEQQVFLSGGGEPDSLTDPVYYNCKKNLSAEYDRIDYSRSLVYSGKALVYRDTDIMPDEERVRTEYFRRIYLANHWHYSLQLVIAKDGIFLGAATFYRKEGEKDFSYDDVFLLDSLKEHLSLALYRDYSKKKQLAQEEADRKPTVSEAAEHYGLTPREKTVLRLLMDGEDHEQICGELSIANNTLKKHIQGIYRKVGVTDRVGLFKRVREKG